MNVAYVRRECGEILFDGLVVADVGKHRVEDRQLRFVCRNGNPRLGHQDKQSNSLEGNRLAAGVRSADDELTIVAIQAQRHRDDGFPSSFEIAIEYRVPGLHKSDMVAAVFGRTWGFHYWLYAFVI